jgi:DNA-binding LacI/PurR family transcriptional regulator
MKSEESVTLRDVALAAGVSIDTVSRVLNGKGKGTWPSAMRRAREIREIAEKLNYRPNAAARAIRSSRTRVVGALVRNNSRDRHIHPVAFETLLGINEGLEAAGYVLAIIRFDDVEFEAAPGSRVFHEHMLDGMIAVDGLPQHVMTRLEKLVPNCVWVNTNVWRDEGCIRRDEVAVGELAAKRMIELGYRRLVQVGGVKASVPHYSHDARFAGMRKAAQQAGVSLERVQLPWNDISAGDFPIELFDPAVGLIAEGATWADWLSNTAAGLGKVPAYHFGLASLDESSDTRRHWPGLSRVSFDHYDMGVHAARMMLQRLDSPDAGCPSKLFKGEWIAGNTAWGPGDSWGLARAHQ